VEQHDHAHGAVGDGEEEVRGGDDGEGQQGAVLLAQGPPAGRRRGGAAAAAAAAAAAGHHALHQDLAVLVDHLVDEAALLLLVRLAGRLLHTGGPARR
jgi:fructose-1,6-bisphosphatase/inositol monophosphatase family enzyme